MFTEVDVVVLKQPIEADVEAQIMIAEDEEHLLPPVKMLTPEESWTFFADLARQLLAISGDEFSRRYHSGRYDDILDDGEHSDLLYLSMLGGLDLDRSAEESEMALRQPDEAPSQSGVEPDMESDYALPPIRMLTIEESRVFFDEQARERLAISGNEFIRRYDAGRYDDVLDDGEHSDLLFLAMLSGLGR